MISDGELLRRYAEEGSQPAFAELVGRHVGIVYRAALRRVGGDAHSADDVTQRVFSDLARKAGALRSRPSLAGWLYTSTRFAAAQAVRGARRRRAHEQEASTMNEINAHDQLAPERIEPFLDEVLELLDERDREAVLLHFFEGRPFAEVGEALRISADAARMRVGRALERLRADLARRGVGSSAAALGAALSLQTGLGAPGPLAALVARRAAGQAAGRASWLASLKSHPALTVAVAGILALSGAGLALRLRGAGSAVAGASPSAASAPAPAADGGAVAEAAPATETAIAEDSLAGAGPSPDRPLTAPAGSDFASLPEAGKSILKTLWFHFQNYADPPGTRWSFGVKGGSSTDFAAASAGAQARGWVGILPDGGVYLTPHGLLFCSAHAAELEAYPLRFRAYGRPDHWVGSGPAPVNASVPRGN